MTTEQKVERLKSLADFFKSDESVLDKTLLFLENIK